ncbi:MAG: DUF6883 domain-containing protein [Microcystaceae cyanobacterium]
MNQPKSLHFTLAKAEYLLTRVAAPGKGGDKQNYWQNILGFQSAEAIRQAILAEITIAELQPKGNHPYGTRLVATIQINTPKGRSRPIATIWLVRFNEDIARFITAIPIHLNFKI